MHIDSSASLTCMRFLSASECTATVFIPKSLHALKILSAISPLLAISTFENMLTTQSQIEVGQIQLETRYQPEWL